jgi:hypothetical protein
MAKKQALFMEKNSIVLYQTEDGQTQIDVRLKNNVHNLHDKGVN